jgi:hypothetical protein
LAGTNPTNAASCLKITSVAMTFTQAGLMLPRQRRRRSTVPTKK